MWKVLLLRGSHPSGKGLVLSWKCFLPLTALRVHSQVLKTHCGKRTTQKQLCRSTELLLYLYPISDTPSSLGSWVSYWQSHLLHRLLCLSQGLWFTFTPPEKKREEILLEETERIAGPWSLQKFRLRIEWYLWSWYCLVFRFDLFRERCSISPFCNKRSIPSALAVTISHFKFWSVRWTFDRAEAGECMQEIYCLGVFVHWTRNDGCSSGLKSISE